jgi:hypothetical protein
MPSKRKGPNNHIDIKEYLDAPKDKANSCDYNLTLFTLRKSN